MPATVQAVFPSITNRVENWRAFNPETLTVSPFPEMPLTFSRVSVKEDSSLTGGHYTIWVGRSPAMPGASLVTVGTDSGYDALLVVPGNGEVNFHVSGAGDSPDEVNMSLVASTEAGCGVGPVPARPEPTPQTTVGIFADKYRAAAQTVEMPTSAILAADGVLTVDLLYLYDSTALAVIKSKNSGDPVTVLDGQLKAVTETMNLFLAQSGIITFKYKYIGVLAAPAYARTGHLGDDLNTMIVGGANGAWVAKTRYDLGADEICLLVGTSEDYGGVATMDPQKPPTSENARCVVAIGGGWGQPPTNVSAIIVAHELGHTMGCNHDRETANIFNDDKYCYGWKTTSTATSGSYSFTTDIGTIMAQVNGRTPYFSNPNLRVDIYSDIWDPQVDAMPIGTPPNMDFGFFTIGVPATTANPQYNAKVMADNGPIVANLMDPVSSIPIITQQPSPTVSLTAGSELQLGVKAMGGALYYQWSKNGTAIGGATGVAFFAFQVTAADAGDYTVAITNSLGTVTSNKATVTITAAPAPTPVPAPSGGGGGAAGVARPACGSWASWPCWGLRADCCRPPALKAVPYLPGSCVISRWRVFGGDEGCRPQAAPDSELKWGYSAYQPAQPDRLRAHISFPARPVRCGR